MPIFRWGSNAELFPALGWMQREMERLLDPFGRFGDSRRVGGGSYPPINIFEGEDDVLVMAEVPGVEQKDLDVSITGETLVLKGVKRPAAEDEGVRFHRRERGSGEFNRVVVLPERVDADRIAARLTDGVLTITLPKSEAAKPKQISVES